MSDVCEHCPHAILDHEDTGCITCKCGTVYFPADPEPLLKLIEVPEVTVPVTSGTVVPQTDEETGTVVPQPEGDVAESE